MKAGEGRINTRVTFNLSSSLLSISSIHQKSELVGAFSITKSISSAEEKGKVTTTYRPWSNQSHLIQGEEQRATS
jgi:hypothetical protein